MTLTSVQDPNLENHSSSARARVAEMSFSVTPNGIQAHIPIIRNASSVYADLSWWDGDSDQSHSVYLRLAPDPTSPEVPSRRSSYVIDHTRIDCPEFEKSLAPRTWETVLVRDRPPPSLLPGQFSWNDVAQPILRAPMQFGFNAPFRFDNKSARTFVHESSAQIVNVDITPLPESSSHLMATYTFGTPKCHFTIRVGECLRDREVHANATAPVWVTFHADRSDVPYTRGQDSKEMTEKWTETLPKDGKHCCGTDHVLQWPEEWTEEPENSEPGKSEDSEMYWEAQDQTQVIPQYSNSNNDQKTFQKLFRLLGNHTVCLSFERCPINPMRTLILKASYQVRLSRNVPH